MISDQSTVESFDMVIFGGTGDLAMRKLLPALYRRYAAGQMSDSSRIIGLAHTERTTEVYRQLVLDSLKQFIPEKEYDVSVIERFISQIEFSLSDVRKPECWTDLKTLLAQRDGNICVYYLAVGPSLFATIAKGLAEAGLNGSETRLVVEKPLGHDLSSARSINQQITEIFDESQVYRIDHYLGKETVQNLMVLRFANVLFEPLWNATYIDHVQITAAETLGVGTRGQYYDNAGAIRDMVQNHLLQLLCLIAMEPPYRFDSNAIRDEKLKVLRSLKPIKDRQVFNHTVRGQYQAGMDSPAYVDEAKNPHSTTESYVAIKAEVHNYRWFGVPFYLRTGKKLRGHSTEIAIVFKKPHHAVFGELQSHINPNVLSIRLQPDEGLQLDITNKTVSPDRFWMQDHALDMSFSEGKTESWRMPDAYENLLMDVVRGNQTLFMRGDEVEAAWQWIDPIIHAWQISGQKPEPYEANSQGPLAALEMIAQEGRRWRKIEA